jgi:hypothetical protein
VQLAAQHSVLIISPMADAPRVAETLSSALGCSVDVAPNHRSGLIALRHRDYSVVVVDDCLVEANPASAELLWQNFGMAVPVQTRARGASGDWAKGTAAGHGFAHRGLPAGKRPEVYADRAPAAVPARARRARTPRETRWQIRVDGRARWESPSPSRARPSLSSGWVSNRKIRSRRIFVRRLRRTRKGTFGKHSALEQPHST